MSWWIGWLEKRGWETFSFGGLLMALGGDENGYCETMDREMGRWEKGWFSE